MTQDQRLTHIDYDFRCHILRRHFNGRCRGLNKILIVLKLLAFRTLFAQFEDEPKRNGHLGSMTPAFPQTYPQLLWTMGPV